MHTLSSSFWSYASGFLYVSLQLMQRQTVWDYRYLRVNWTRGRFQIFDCGNPAEGSLSIFRLVDLHKEIHFLKCLKTKWILALWNFQIFHFRWLPSDKPSHEKVDHVLNVRNHRPYRIFLVEILTRSSSIKKLRVFYKSDICVVLFLLSWSQDLTINLYQHFLSQSFHVTVTTRILN